MCNSFIPFVMGRKKNVNAEDTDICNDICSYIDLVHPL